MRRRTIRWIAALAFTGLVAVFVRLVTAERPPLLKAATRLTIVSVPPDAYAWISDRELLLFLTKRAVCMDLTTGSQSEITSISHVLRSGTLLDSLHPRASPDGRWVAYAAETSPSGWQENHLYISSVADTRRFDGPWDDPSTNTSAGAPSTLAWLPDSLRRLEWMPTSPKNAAASLCSLDTTHAVDVAVPPAVETLLGVTSDFHLLATDFFAQSGKAYSSVDVYDVGLFPQPSPARKITLHLPSGADVREVVLSPDGSRLAWKLYRTTLPLGVPLLERLFPSLAKHFHPRYGFALWTCRVDGREMHEIGNQPFKPGASPSTEPSDIAWTPDGKRLSFLCNGALYIIPAD